jgi:hypothetical protein
MPHLDYYLTTDVELTKDRLRQAEQPLLTPDLVLGQDNRTWNAKRLQALKLVLCNLVMWGHKDGGVFLYSRDKQQVLRMFNPFQVGYSSLYWVIDTLTQAKLIASAVALPRTKGKKAPKKLSEFHSTTRAIRFAKSLGITKDTVKEFHKGHVRLREHDSQQRLPHEWNDYSRHIEMEMASYCAYLNKYNILESTEDYEEKGFKGWGLRGEEIHLYRNYRNHEGNPDLKDDLGKLWIEGNTNFCLGGRSGGYWHSSKPEDRKFILIDGKRTARADFPASHVNILYTHETNNWYQKETYKELKCEGRQLEDAYTIADADRAIGKKMLTIMLNCKGTSATSRVFNDWLYKRNKDPKDNATDEEVALYHKALKATGVKQKHFNIWFIRQLSDKHYLIKDYLMKGKVAGQIMQWIEANHMHHLACSFQEHYNFPVLTVYDEFIVPEEHYPMVKEFMFTTSIACEVCDHYSLMNQIKNL